MNKNLPGRFVFSAVIVAMGILTGPFGSLVLAAEPPTVVKQGKAPPSEFTPERPGYMHIREVRVTRNQKQELTFEIKLSGEIPSRTDEKLRYYIGFDIDNDAGTGSIASTSPGFGQDIGIWFIRQPKSSQFKESTGEVVYKGVKRDLKIGLARFQGDTITFKVRSDLFSLFPSTKIFVSAEHTFYEKGKETQSVEVSQSGNFILGSE